MQFGHLFARGDTRTAAVRAMVVALKEVKIRGEIRTLVDYAIDMIQVGSSFTCSCIAYPAMEEVYQRSIMHSHLD
jgi:hypothetical protein